MLIGSDSGIKAGHQLWVDTNDVTPYVNSEISNDYGTAQNLGYSQKYVNDRFDGTKSMGDVVVDSIRSKNLFNKYNVIGAYLDANGNTHSNTDHSVSDYIDISGIDYLTLSGNEGTGIVNCFYNSSKTVIGSVTITNQSTKTMEVPSNSKFIRVTVKNTALDNYQLEKGSTATEYRPYQNLDGVDRGRILWSNSSPNSNMEDGTTINLNSDKYDVLEIYYKYTTSANMMWCKKIIKGYNTYLDIAVPYYTNANYVANEFRNFTRVSDTQYTVSKCYVVHTDNTQLYREDMIIPLYIVGYKTGLF